MASAKSNGKGGRSRAAAARTEKAPKGKTFDFAGEKFNLPPALPDTILFDFAEIEVAGGNPLPMYRMLRSILGAEQFSVLRGLVEAGDVLVEQLDEFIEGIFEQYGITAGESSASLSS